MSGKCNCDSCNQTSEEFYNGIAKHIQEYGWVCMHIEDHKREEPTFTYTIGNVEKDMPELFMGVNVRREMAHRIMINVMLHWQEHGVQLGGNSYILHGMDVELVEVNAVEAAESYMFQHTKYYSDDRPMRVVQIVLPDQNGRLPGDVGYCMPQLKLGKWDPKKFS